MCAHSDHCQETSVALSRGNSMKPRYEIVHGSTTHALISQTHGVGRVQRAAHGGWGEFSVQRTEGGTGSKVPQA
jgi:hypothetical protein